MKNLKPLLVNYLSKDTDYAIQIVGRWGSGKTYYYKNHLEPLINTTAIHNDNERKYKTVYISLFGLKSIEDISTKIVAEFYQSKLFNSYFRNEKTKKKINITNGILKIAFRGFISFNKLGSTNEHLTDIKDIAKDVLNTDELLICFDDLERKDSSLKLTDAIGYINSLVDEKVKVLIIANEDLLLGDPTYKDLKEKVIGVTVEYIPSNREILLEIIKNNFEGFKVYRDFLLNQIDFLEDELKAINNNFRHLVYGLNSLQIVYSMIKNDIIDSNDAISFQVNQQLDNIVKLTLALSFEYKQSKLGHHNIDDYNDDSKMMLHLTNSNRDTDKDQIPMLGLIKKYNIGIDNYFFYDSIYNFVIGHDDFVSDKFVKEFKSKFKLENGEMLPHYKLLSELDYQHIYNLTEEEYKTKTLEVIKIAEEGKYDFETYYSVMHYAERLNNILNLDLNEVSERLQKGLRLSIDRNIDHPDIEGKAAIFRLNAESFKLNKYVEAIFDCGMQYISSLSNKKDSEKLMSVIDDILNNTDHFYKKYEEDKDYRRYFNKTSILQNINPDELIISLIRTSNANVNKFRFMLKSRYNLRYSDNIEILSEEKDTLVRLLPLLEEALNVIKEKKEINFKSHLFNELISQMKLDIEFTKR